jgi:hypothetical protein
MGEFDGYLRWVILASVLCGCVLAFGLLRRRLLRRVERGECPACGFLHEGAVSMCRDCGVGADAIRRRNGRRLVAAIVLGAALTGVVVFQGRWSMERFVFSRLSTGALISLSPRGDQPRNLLEFRARLELMLRRRSGLSAAENASWFLRQFDADELVGQVVLQPGGPEESRGLVVKRAEFDHCYWVRYRVRCVVREDGRQIAEVPLYQVPGPGCVPCRTSPFLEQKEPWEGVVTVGAGTELLLVLMDETGYEMLELPVGRSRLRP